MITLCVACCRPEFDKTADLLSEKLLDLDHAVHESVIDQMATVVVDSSAPVDRLVEAVNSAATLVSDRQTKEHALVT